jgi:hypothetical protein
MGNREPAKESLDGLSAGLQQHYSINTQPFGTEAPSRAEASETSLLFTVRQANLQETVDFG